MVHGQGKSEESTVGSVLAGELTWSPSSLTWLPFRGSGNGQVPLPRIAD
jgi:hypothetical protein